MEPGGEITAICLRLLPAVPMVSEEAFVTKLRMFVAKGTHQPLPTLSMAFSGRILARIAQMFPHLGAPLVSTADALVQVKTSVIGVNHL